MTDDPLRLLTPAPPRRRWLLVAAIAAAALVVGIGGTIAATNLLSADTVTVKGEVSLYGSDHVDGGDGNCRGTGGFVDLRLGAEVVVTDNAGATVGLTSLRDARLITDGGTHCVFTFAVDVPAGKGFYGVQVTHRGRLQFSEAQLGSVRMQIGL